MTIASSNQPSTQMQTAPTREYVYLLGRPSLTDFLHHVKRISAQPSSVDEPALTERWCEANGLLRRLETEEAGWADLERLEPLPETMAEVAEAKLQEPTVQRGLRFGAARWAWVEIDRLVVYQRTMDLHRIEALKARLPPRPTDAELIRIATGQQIAAPDIRFTQQADNVYSLISLSSDIRVLDVAPLQPEDVHGFQSCGYAAKVIAVFVGHSVNLFSALHFRNRLLLINGSHRIYALRELGVTHVPCLVESLSHVAKFELIHGDVEQNAELYFGARRPPLFKDYRDPRLRLVFTAQSLATLVNLQFASQKLKVPVV